MTFSNESTSFNRDRKITNPTRGWLGNFENLNHNLEKP